MLRKGTIGSSRYLLLFLFFVGAARNAAAEDHRVGIRGGISADPEQVYFGAHVDLKEIVDRFWFRPNVEIGLGDGLTVAAFNGEFVYLLRVKSREWTPYVGGGPGLVVRTFRSGQAGGDTGAGPGFNFVGGVQQSKGLLAEIKVGAFDSPGFKLGIGWTW
jgi:hypothetical protein